MMEMTDDEYRSEVRTWIDEDEKLAHEHIDMDFAMLLAAGAPINYSEWYGGQIEPLKAEIGAEMAVQFLRAVTLGYVLRGRMDEMLPKEHPNA